uniref:Uncharacterized protein n=1 Tax=Sphaerodactylus townsendi TaxID=933632 RepID=A0ACB8EZW9_9SAUR
MQLRAGLLPLALLCATAAAAAAAGSARRLDGRARRDASPAPGTCATRLARGRRAPDPPPPPPRHPGRRRRAALAAGGRAWYFGGGPVRLRAALELPRDAFTWQAWLRAEGGQKAPAVIAGGIILGDSVELRVTHRDSPFPDGIVFGRFPNVVPVPPERRCGAFQMVVGNRRS